MPPTRTIISTLYPINDTHAMKPHSPNSRHALRLALLASTLLTSFSNGLPRGSKKDNTFNSSSLARRTGATGQDSSLTTLRDSFPCESDAGSSLSSGLSQHDVGSSGDSCPVLPGMQNDGSSSDLSSKAGETRKPHSFISNPVNAPRGGGDIASSHYDDDEIDRMVEDLIAGVENGLVREGEDDLDDADLHVDNLLDEAVDTEVRGDIDSSHHMTDDDSEKAQDEDGSEQTTDCRTEPTASVVSTSPLKRSNSDATSKQSPSTPSTTTSISTAESQVITPRGSERAVMTTSTAIPTNAYYRFLVRRGPKGHILASFSLLSVQWIHIYLPFVYRFIASVLFTFRIYDPEQLHIKERERMLEMQRRRERTTLAQKLKSKFASSSSSARKQIQKEADERAASKLQQLLKTTMATSLDWKEVRYRYLSVGFRKRHELGAEYVKKKPVLFMGEEVGGGVEDGDGDGVVVDLEEELDNDVSEEHVVVDAGEQRKHSRESKKHHPRRKRKITDWVVRAFESQPPSSLSTRASEGVSSPISNSALSLWKSVKRNDILNAAWESRNAEKSVWASNKMDQLPRTDAQPHLENDKTSNFSSASASKMFQSVMTRVGSNGRILGAYPMDAPHIEECANRRGVLDLARRYGYGNWDDDDVEENRDESGGEEEESWGGGDLFFDAEEDDSPKGPRLMGELSRRRDPGKKKQQKIMPSNDALFAKPTISRRKRKQKSTNQSKVATISFSGGGSTNVIPRRKVTFEFGMGAQSSQRQNDSFRFSTERPKSTTKPSTERNPEVIRSQLQERSSSILFASDTLARAPMQLLDKSMKKRGKENKNEIE